MKEFCSQGHKLAEVGVYGNGFCRECGRANAIRNHRKRMEEKRAQGLAPGHGRWNKDGFCRSGRHILAEVGVYIRKDNGDKRCRACHLENMRHERELHPRTYEKRRNARLEKLYGITVEQYENLFAAQDGKCAVCHESETAKDARSGRPFQLSVDHDHVTGRVRALLCHRCNRFAQEPNLIKALSAYLQSH